MVLGWLWGSSSSSPSNLDPSLQKILDDQKNSQPSSLPTSTRQTTYTQQLRETGDLPQRPQDAPSQPQEPKVPPQSLYPDGRYAHLWKNYEPQHVVSSRGETELDKLRRLSDESESRRVKLGQAALENCVFEQLAELDCLKNGGPARRLTMCRPEKQLFNRCYEMQVKFLKALGYWEVSGPGMEERAEAVQMHSDKLWGRLVEQEKAIELAKEEGRPIPQFDSILSPANVQAVGGALIKPNFSAKQQAAPTQASKPQSPPSEAYPYPSIPEPLRETFDTRVKDLSAPDAKIEEAVFLAEMEQKRQQFTEAGGYLRAEGDARRKRYETGEASVGDRIKRWANWDAWDSRFPLPADAQKREQAEGSKGEGTR
jgi:hypothetical protein